MADRPPPYDRRPTRPRDRARLAPVGPALVEDPPSTRPALAEAKAVAREAEDDIITMVPCPSCAGSKARPCASCRALGMVEPTRSKTIETEVACPLCCGGGKVAPEIAAMHDEDMARRKERA